MFEFLVKPILRICLFPNVVEFNILGFQVWNKLNGGTNSFPYFRICIFIFSKKMLFTQYWCALQLRYCTQPRSLPCPTRGKYVLTTTVIDCKLWQLLKKSKIKCMTVWNMKMIIQSIISCKRHNMHRMLHLACIYCSLISDGSDCAQTNHFIPQQV